ncbi:MAG: riboflavin biosynthesis protein RibF [Puniceicoccales bacterium]
MKTFRTQDFTELQSIRRPVHLAIGMFDGLHIGHQAVIHSATQAAQLDGSLCGILTFDPHPSHLFRPDSPTPQIYPPTVKEELLREMGLDLCLIQTFDPAFASHTAEDFVNWIRETVPTLASVSVGENFRFGKGRAGAPTLLVEKLKNLGISVFSCERVHLDGDPISSTRIRGILPQRPIQEVNHLLGRPYHSIGVVQEGKKLGRTLGFPTLNLPVQADILPPFGVYLVRYRLHGEGREHSRHGIANFGLRPTMENSTVPRLEVHSLDPCNANYGDTVVSEWIRFIRPEQKFESLEALQKSIQSDRETALQWMQRDPA